METEQLRQPAPRALNRTISETSAMVAGGVFLCFLVAGVLYGWWNYQTWQYEWATGCASSHGGLSKAEWVMGFRPVNDCRPWWVRWIAD